MLHKLYRSTLISQSMGFWMVYMDMSELTCAVCPTYLSAHRRFSLSYHCPSVNWAMHLAPFFGTKAPASGGLAVKSCLISFIIASNFGPSTCIHTCISYIHHVLINTLIIHVLMIQIVHILWAVIYSDYIKIRLHQTRTNSAIQRYLDNRHFILTHKCMFYLLIN